MRRALLATSAFAALALAPSAEAKITELGADALPVDPKASCPDNCQAIGRVSGYMGRSGKARDPFKVPRDGKILAFTVTLGKPDASQVKFFTDLYGGPPQVRISVVRRYTGKSRKHRLDHRLLRQSENFRVDPYFGSSPSFVFDEPLKVSKGNIVALTVPTWAPAFAVNMPNNNWWRSSRKKKQCDNVAQRAAQRTVNGVRVYGCTYFGARLLYTVTYAPDPRRTDVPKKK
jgi:hypothetical protein